MADLVISFTPASPAPANGYIVKYRLVGDPSYITLGPNPTASPVTITGLAAGQYEGTVQSDCGTSTGTEITFISNTLDCSVGIDMVFILDTTGSMGSTITNLKTSISSYTAKVIEKSNDNYRFGLVTVNENTGGPEIIARPVLFSANNEAELLAGLDPLTASGGGNTPEPTDVALGYILEDVDNYVGTFRVGVVKIVILITDALASGGNDEYTDPTDSDRVADLAALAGSMGVRIFALNVGAGISIPQVVTDMQLYATQSFGIYSESPTGAVSTNIIDALDALCSNVT